MSKRYCPSTHSVVQLFALCSMLGAATTAVKGLTLGLIVLGSLVTATTLFVPLRRVTASELQPMTGILLLIGVVTAADITTHAVWPTLHGEIGIFLPLLAGTAVLLATTEIFGSNATGATSIRAAAKAGTGILCAATLLGCGREIVGHGSLLRDLALFLEPFTPMAVPSGITLFAHERGFLLALLPPGALIALGLLLALRNLLKRSLRLPLL